MEKKNTKNKWTIVDIDIRRNFGVRPNRGIEIYGHAWAVDEGEPYDLVCFKIGEIGTWWETKLCIPCCFSDREIKKIVQNYAEKEIFEKDVEAYKQFLRDIDKWGCD